MAKIGSSSANRGGSIFIKFLVLKLFYGKSKDRPVAARLKEGSGELENLVFINF